MYLLLEVLMQSARISLPLILLLGVAGCGGDGGTGPETPGPPTTLTKISGDNQVGAVGQALPEPIRVRVTDAKGRPVSDVSVEFTVESGGGSIAASAAPNVTAGAASGVGLAVAISDEDGEAEATWTLGTIPGPHSASARIVSTTVSPVSFVVTAQAGPPAVVTTPGMYAGTVGQPLVGPMAVKVRDQYGNAVPDVTVTWQIVAGGGVVEPTASQTRASGFAETSLTLGSNVGANTVRAGVGGLAPIDVIGVGVEPVVDPVSDAVSVGGSAIPNITRFGGLAVGESLVIYIEFTDSVFSDLVDDARAIFGYIEIDTDQDPATGVTSLVDRAGGSTGLGVDHFVALDADAAGRYPIAEILNDSVGIITGVTTPVFSANSVTIEVFLSSLGGDDGNVNATAILGKPTGATDVVPNQGHVVLAPAGPAVSASRLKYDGPTDALMPRWRARWLERGLMQLQRLSKERRSTAAYAGRRVYEGGSSR